MQCMLVKAKFKGENFMDSKVTAKDIPLENHYITTVQQLLLKQQACGVDNLCCEKYWTYFPSASRPYTRCLAV